MPRYRDSTARRRSQAPRGLRSRPAARVAPSRRAARPGSRRPIRESAHGPGERIRRAGWCGRAMCRARRTLSNFPRATNSRTARSSAGRGSTAITRPVGMLRRLSGSRIPMAPHPRSTHCQPGWTSIWLSQVSTSGSQIRVWSLDLSGFPESRWRGTAPKLSLRAARRSRCRPAAGERSADPRRPASPATGRASPLCGRWRTGPGTSRSGSPSPDR